MLASAACRKWLRRGGGGVGKLRALCRRSPLRSSLMRLRSLHGARLLQKASSSALSKAYKRREGNRALATAWRHYMPGGARAVAAKKRKNNAARIVAAKWRSVISSPRARARAHAPARGACRRIVAAPPCARPALPCPPRTHCRARAHEGGKCPSHRQQGRRGDGDDVDVDVDM